MLKLAFDSPAAVYVLEQWETLSLYVYSGAPRVSQNQKRAHSGVKSKYWDLHVSKGERD